MAYTPIVTTADLHTHIYDEQLDEITRDDGGILAGKALDIAFDEVKAYLSRFDLLALFGSSEQDVSASVSDEFLKNLIKDIAVWQIIKLGNPSINYDHSRWCYEAALSTLEKIQAAGITPQNWPLMAAASPQSDVTVQSSSTPLRNNYY